MRAILLGGPRHLQEFEVGNNPPPVWLVPKMAPFTPSLGLGDDPYSVPKLHFHTVTYNLQRERPGGYAIYLSEERDV